jgi:hypothetical protein
MTFMPLLYIIVIAHHLFPPCSVIIVVVARALERTNDFEFGHTRHDLSDLDGVYVRLRIGRVRRTI